MRLCCILIFSRMIRFNTRKDQCVKMLRTEGPHDIRHRLLWFSQSHEFCFQPLHHGRFIALCQNVNPN